MVEIQTVLWEEVWRVGGVVGSIHKEAMLAHAQLIFSHPLHPIPQLQCPCFLQCFVYI